MKYLTAQLDEESDKEKKESYRERAQSSQHFADVLREMFSKSIIQEV